MNTKLFTLSLIPFLFTIPNAFSQTEHLVENLAEEFEKSKDLENRVKLLVYTDADWTAEIHDGNYVTHKIDETGSNVFLIPCGQTDLISVTVNSMDSKYFDVYLMKAGKILAYSEDALIFQETSLDCSMNKELMSILDRDFEYVNYLYLIIAVIIVTVTVVILIRKKQNSKYKLQ